MLRVNTEVLDLQAENIERLSIRIKDVVDDLYDCSTSLMRQNDTFDREVWAIRRQVERGLIEEKSLHDMGTALNSVSDGYKATETKLACPKDCFYMNGVLVIGPGYFDGRIIEPVRPKPGFFIDPWKMRWMLYIRPYRRPRPVRPPRPIRPFDIIWPRVWPPRRPAPVWNRYDYYRPGNRNIIWRMWVRRWLDRVFRRNLKTGLLTMGPRIETGPVVIKPRAISFVPVGTINTEINTLLRPMLKGGEK